MITFSCVLCLCARVLLCLCPMSLSSRVDVYLYSVSCVTSQLFTVFSCVLCHKLLSFNSYRVKIKATYLLTYLLTHVHIIVLSVFMFNIFAFCVVAVLCWSCCFLFLRSLLLPWNGQLFPRCFTIKTFMFV